jgi:OOP family OmpA-OmpF porin
MMIKQLTVAAALALAASAAIATPTGFYIGGDVVTTKIDDFDGNKTGGGVFAGYGINQNVAIEAGYRDLGTWTYRGVDVGAKQAHVSVLASLPLAANVDVYGRVGYNNIKVDTIYGGDENVSNALVGIGLSYTFMPNLSGRIEVQKAASDTTHGVVSMIWKF